MTKDSAAWLIVRTIGLLVVFLAVSEWLIVAVRIAAVFMVELSAHALGAQVTILVAAEAFQARHLEQSAVFDKFVSHEIHCREPGGVRVLSHRW